MYYACMANVQIREVPDEIHAELVRRAAAAGMSLQQYLSAQLRALVARPTLDDVLDRIEARPPARLGGADAVSALDTERAGR